MSGNHTDDDHVTALLGAYAMDRVDDEERDRILRHLLRCDRCRDDFEYIRPVPAVLDLLRPADVEDLLPRPDPTSTPPWSE